MIRLGRVNALALLAVALAFRVVALGRLPGVNGDEAWYGVWALECLQGHAVPWRTPAGNPINPFYMLPQLLLHSFLRPSFWLLRSTAVISGIAALPVNFWLCRRVFGRRVAWLSTLLLAVLPINVAYSRFGWDASQSLLATALVVYTSLAIVSEPQRSKRWLALSVSCLLCATLVHPTNVMMGLLPVVASLLRWCNRIPAKWRERNWQIIVAIAGIVATGLVGVMVRVVRGRWLPLDGMEFLRNYVRLFSGTTIYRYVPGSQQATDPLVALPGIDFLWLDGVWLAFFVVAVLVVFRTCRARGLATAEGALALGWALGASGFYVAAGPLALSPGWERYGMVLVVPGALLLARASSTLRRPGAMLALGVAGWGLLAGFATLYFGVLAREGGHGHPTFRTGSTEPKQAALEYVLALEPPIASTIVASAWWNYWPLRYLAMAEGRVEVEKAAPGGFREALAERRIWFVEFTESHESAQVRSALARGGYTIHEHVVRDAGGRALLSVIGPG